MTFIHKQDWCIRNIFSKSNLWDHWSKFVSDPMFEGEWFVHMASFLARLNLGTNLSSRAYFPVILHAESLITVLSVDICINIRQRYCHNANRSFLPPPINFGSQKLGHCSTIDGLICKVLNVWQKMVIKRLGTMILYIFMYLPVKWWNRSLQTEATRTCYFKISSKFACRLLQYSNWRHDVKRPVRREIAIRAIHLLLHEDKITCQWRLTQWY